VARSLRARRQGFNGATAMKPWKRWTLATVGGTRRLLQWGHGDEAVEESAPRGKPWPPLALQWGHGDEAVEEPTTLAKCEPTQKLQWGHGDEAVEERNGKEAHRQL